MEHPHTSPREVPTSFSKNPPIPNGEGNDGADGYFENIKVCLRLRPMNKLEESRRSRNCVEVHENKTITVNSPLDGEFDCSFNWVFNESAGQKLVYEHSASHIPSQLLAGYNCAVIAYGQTGSGKTHTMIGAGGDSHAAVAKKTARSMERKGDRTFKSTLAGPLLSVPDQDDPNYETSGMIPRVIRDLFREIEESDPNVEYTVRCSCIEIYLERILDLLDPSARNLSVVEVPMAEFDEELRGRIPYHLFAEGENGVYIEGMTEACCFDEADVMALFVRGNATRTVSSTRMNTDSSRSHAIFIVTVEQKDMISGRTRLSHLHMVDLAGSEISGVCKKNRRATVATTSIQQEAMMINKSLASLGSVVRALTENAKRCSSKPGDIEEVNQKTLSPVNVPYKSSKLTRVLRDALGGNCFTTFILTASPSSYNIGETINTIRFGQRARLVTNFATRNEDWSIHEYKTKLEQMEGDKSDLRDFIQSICQECWKLRRQGQNGKLSDAIFAGPLWDTIEMEMAKDAPESEDGEETVDNDTDSQRDEVPPILTSHSSRRMNRADSKKGLPLQNLLGKIRSTTSLKLTPPTPEQQEAEMKEEELKKAKQEIERLKQALHKAQVSRDHSESLLAEVQSGLAVLRTQNETLTKEKKKITLDLINAKNEVELLTSQKLDLETRFRTSQFRENEATIFLRQFRMFYRRLLRNKAAHGTGEVADIIGKIPEVPDLNDLVDIDIVLYQCGLIEEEELNDDQTYIDSFRPSQEAMSRSTTAAMEGKPHPLPWENGGNGEGHNTSPLLANSPSIGTTTTTSTTSFDLIRSTPQTGLGRTAHRQLPPSTSTTTSINTNVTTSNVDSQSSTASDTPHQLHQAQTEKEKELTADLRRMTERCIELQIALNQEKSNVDVLTNRAGSLRQKRLAQEAIALRKELDRKTHDVQLIIWKMNELNMINKAYNEKMKNRDHHVNYLEECLVDLQNVNKGLVADKLESEGKLREGLENLQALVDAMTVPLWQFGEGKTGAGGRKLANRVLLPIRGKMDEEGGGDGGKGKEEGDGEVGGGDDDEVSEVSLPSEVESMDGAYEIPQNNRGSGSAAENFNENFY